MNPFLDNSFKVRWTKMTYDCVRPDIGEAIKLAEAGLEAIRSIDPALANYDNVFEALEDATDELSRPWARVNHLEEVCDSPEMRAAYNDVLPEVSAFYARIPLDERLWKSVHAASLNPGAMKLDEAQNRFVGETLKDFLDAGAELSSDKKDRLQQLQSELSALTQKFSENVLDSTNAFELVVEDPALLSGLPAHAREAARRDALRKGHGTEANPKWRFTLQSPSYGPAMQYLDSDEMRRQLYEGFTRIGRTAPYDNTELIWKILELRNEKALLLGKASFADVTTARRMAGSGRAALDFVEDMHKRISPAFVREIRGLEEFKAARTGKPVEHLQIWETSYWMEKLRRERYDFDEEKLRPYFAIQGVISGMFRIVEGLFGLRIVELTGEDKPEVWHPDVRFYDLFDAGSDTHLGSFYTDWHPRASKRSGAWMDGLITGVA
ncbi:MAG: M3 family metallopeptidase, partial [Opitutales bacterium]